MDSIDVPTFILIYIRELKFELHFHLFDLHNFIEFNNVFTR